MPENAKQPLTKRDLVTPQETFRYTTPKMDVNARPTDPFVKPEPTPLGNIIELTKSVHQGIDSYGQYKFQQNKEDVQAGAAAQMRGEVKPVSGSWAVIRGYEETEGKAGVYDYHVTAQQYLEENKNLDPVEFKAGLDKITRKYTDGASDNFLRGFKDQALATEGAVMSRYQTEQLKQKREDAAINVTKAMQMQMPDVLTNPQAARAFVTQLQQNNSGLLTKTEVANAVMESVIAQAYQTGNPDYFKFALEPDANGITLAQVYGPDKLQQKILHAETMSIEREKLKILKEAKEKTRVSDEISKSGFTRAATLKPGSVDEAAGLMGWVLQQEGKMDQGDYIRLLDHVQKLNEHGGVTDPSSRAEAYNIISAGSATKERLDILGQRINPMDMTHIWAAFYKDKEQADNREYQEKKQVGGTYYHQGLKMIEAKIQFGGSLTDSQDVTRKTIRFNDEWNLRVEYEKKHTGKELSPSDYSKIQKEILKDIDPELLNPPTASPTSTGSSGAPKKPTAGSKAPDTSTQEKLKSLTGQPPAAEPLNPGEVPLSKVDSFIKTASTKHGLDDFLVKAMIQGESSYDSKAVSGAGAKGLMQLMPETAHDMGVTDPFDPDQNIHGGVKYMKQMLARFDNNLELALAAYNAGPGAVEKFNGVPPYPETQKYVKKVLALYNKARGFKNTVG